MWAPNDIDDAASEFPPHRCRGRPLLNLDNIVRTFWMLHFSDPWQNLSIDVLRNSMDDFVHYFFACEHDVEILEGS